MNLANVTKEVSPFFKTKKNIILNSTFGNYSRLVGGADIDYIIGNTLFDIKTTNYYSYNNDYINQLIGYYLLSEYDKSFPVKINKIALYYARFNKIIYLEIEDLKKNINLNIFSKYFYEIIKNNNYKDLKSITYEKLTEKILK